MGYGNPYNTIFRHDTKILSVIYDLLTFIVPLH